MPQKKPASFDSLSKNFLVRFKDKEVISLVEKALDSHLFPDRTTLINECCREYLKSLKEKESEISVRNIVKDELEKSVSILKTDLIYLRKSFELFAIIQNTDDKLLTRFFNLFEYFMNNMDVPPVAESEMVSGAFDSLPHDIFDERERLFNISKDRSIR